MRCENAITDFTGRAHELLFERVTLHAETTLADIFRLMEASPLLKKVYHNEIVLMKSTEVQDCLQTDAMHGLVF